jgi:hypothetical protein
MSESESAPKRVIPKPIKAADLPAKPADAPKQDRENRDGGGDKRGKGNRKGRDEPKEAAPRVSAALQRGPRFTPPKPEPEPIVEAVENTESVEDEGADASSEPEAAPEE